MATDRLTPLDMNGLELLNVLLHVIAGNPGSPAEGQYWYNSATGKFMFRDADSNVDPTARAEHTGTQLAATISDFDTAVRTSRLDQMAAPTAAVGLNGQKVTGLADGTAATDAATWGQVQAHSAGRDWKDSVRAATTANVNLANALENGDTIDGVALATGDRVLVKDQSAPAENGIYVVQAAGAAVRATDADTAAELGPGTTVTVEEGTANADTRWIVTTNAPIVLGTTGLTFTRDAGEVVNAGAGLTKTGTTLAVGAGATPGSGGPGGGLVANADDLVIDKDVVVRKVSADCAAATTTTVTHNLGTRDVTVQVYRNASPWDEVLVDVERPNANEVLVRFAVAPAAGDFRIVVHG